ncbi:MAG: hypothetical protein CL875_04970 [Dehalococcoidales bacterium]|jgi:hypothetical protein|nr:hypothetical protein [Dehalococcoidales bacterium]
MTLTNPSITDLAAIVDSLPADEKKLFQRIYAVTTTIGELRTPPSIQPWVKRQFGSVAAVTRQKIVKVTNVVTNEGTLFNRLRDFRPIEAIEDKSLDTQLREAIQKDTFRYPEEDTPEDLFGRIAGKHCITASNIAKYDGLHGVVIFNEFNPLQFSREQVIDYIDVGWEWAKRAQATHPQAKYFLFVWNCLFRAGASIVHGHAQMMLTEGRHYAKIEGLRQAALSYQQNYGSNYFTDMFRVHHSVGCAMDKGGVKILASLTPFRNNEVILIADELNLSLKERIYEMLACFRDELGVVSFNLGLITPPLAQTEESWEGFPVMVGVVDRGNPNSRASDVGGVEIYAASVVSSDPFELARQLKQYFD